MQRTRRSVAVAFCWLGAFAASMPGVARGEWKEHTVHRGDGRGGWIALPAQRQVLRHPDCTHTMPFGIVQGDDGELALLCSREKQRPQGGTLMEPVIAWSKDGGATWSEFRAVPKTTGRPQYFTHLGGRRLSFVTEVFDKASRPQRIYSNDFGRTWTEAVDHPPTKTGMPFNLEGNAWVDRDRQGNAQAVLELGWHYAPGKNHPKDDATVVFRRSRDGGKTWADEVAPPQWKFTTTHAGKAWLRGVSEGAIVRAVNGDLVAALRSDMPPRYFDGPNDDSLEGTTVSISKDDGRTWSPMQFLFDAGRHHANLQRFPNGDLVCTLVVRDDIRNEKLASHRRGCDAVVSHDHGKTWDTSRRYELDRFDFLRKDGYWVDGVCGHIGAAALRDGSVISVYGHYQLGAAVLIRWRPQPADAAATQSSASPPSKSEPPRVAIVTGPAPDEVERYAASELAGYLKKLFGIQSTPSTKAPPSADAILLVGRPESNPAVAAAVGPGLWPRIGPQGVVLRPVRVAGTPGLAIGGGSSAATLWAVYELVETWGVRYLLHGDVLPEQPGRFCLPATETVREPVFPMRQWRVVNDFACGPESWGIDDYRRVLDQLAKLRFNRVFASIYPYQPFLDLKVGGIGRQSATLWYGYRYPITDDMPGRRLFGDQREFWNPDLPRGASYTEFAAAGRRLLTEIFAHAKRRGMQCAVTATLLEYPPEFAPLLRDAQKVQQLEALHVVPGPKTEIDDPAVAKLATAVLRATLESYPDVDYLSLGMPEFRQWAGQYEKAYRALDAKYHLGGDAVLRAMVDAASRRVGYPGGAERAVQEVKGDLVALYFYDRLLADRNVLRRPQRSNAAIQLNSVAEELFGLLPKLLPPGSETLNFVDYTPARILKRREALRRLAGGGVPASLIYTLHDDNVGLVPQLATGSLHEITGELRRCGASGFSTRYWLLIDQDPCVAYLAAAAWRAEATPAAVYRSQVAAACGPAAVDPMLEVFREVEAATVALEWHGLGFSFPIPGMMMKHWEPRPLPAELAAVAEHYRRALAAARTARDAATQRGRPYVDAWIGRLEFGIGYFDAVQSLRTAAAAEARKDSREAARHADAAFRRAHEGLEAYARVAADRSDLGALATMAEYVDRPLKQKRDELQRAAGR